MECRFVRGFPVGTPQGQRTCGGSVGCQAQHSRRPGEQSWPRTALAWTRELGLELSDRARPRGANKPRTEDGANSADAPRTPASATATQAVLPGSAPTGLLPKADRPLGERRAPAT